MTIPLDNLYDYIFSLTGHTNKNLIMYRFDPHGEKNMENLIFHDKMDAIYVKLGSTKKKKVSIHYKLIFCHDQEPLDFELYSNDFQSRKNIFKSFFGNGDKEANHFENHIFQKMMLKNNISGHPNVLHSIYDKKILLHSEKNSADLDRYKKNGFIGAYYWAHALIALDWYRFAKYDQRLDFTNSLPFKNDFNIYCRAWTGSREYRLKFLSYLKENNIDKRSNIFFNDYQKNGQHYSKYNPKLWKITDKDIQNINSINATRNKNIESSLSATYNINDYNNSAIDIVLETVFDKNKIQLTEKILRPIACGKPFILASEKNSLEYLRSYGFKTFDNLIDESYDLIEDPDDRLNAIVNTMNTIHNMNYDEKKSLFLKMHKIANYNKKWFFSGKFLSVVVGELKTNLKASLKILDNERYQTAKQIRTFIRAYNIYKDYYTQSEQKLLEYHISELEERIELSRKNIGIS